MTGVPVLPAGSRLLHIGPHKTGTTTLQAAFDHSREALSSQDVHYAGARAHSMVAAMAAARGDSLPTQTRAATLQWEALLEEVRGVGTGRVVISSEFYSEAGAERIRAIADALDRDRIQVVVTLRPLVRILPSQWQQYMQNRMVIGYEAWLHEMLDEPGASEVTPSFWRRHRHERLVDRWVEVVGPERLTVVVVDESDKSMLTSTFEGLVGVRAGTLTSPEGRANRSLTLDEVELLRSFNQLWRERGWGEADYTRLVRFGAARHLQQRRPSPEEHRLRTPPWAVERACAVAEEMVGAIAASGVRVVGDLDSLSRPPEPRDVGTNPVVDVVPPEVVARLGAGLLAAVTAVPRRDPAETRVVGPIESAARLRPVVAAPSPARSSWRQRMPLDRAGVVRVGHTVRRRSSRALSRIRARVLSRPRRARRPAQ